MTPVRIALIYLVISSLWILLSDRLVHGLVPSNNTSLLFWQTAKGWLFVALSGALVYFLALRMNWALSRQLDLKRRHLALVRRKAYTDDLTGISNRRYGARVLNRLLAQAQRSGHGFCVMLLNVDNFKQVNDNLGHNEGDRVIVEVSRRLQEALKPGEQLMRQSGDEFLITCAGAEGRHRIAVRAGQILDLISQPMTIDGLELTITGSLGIACYPDDGDQIAELMRSADLALHNSKKYKHCFNFYQSMMADSLQYRFDLQQKLREALASGALTVYFQPIYDPVEERFTGAEALVRWPTNEGFISPAEFIPVAEQSGQIRALGNRVMEQAFRETQALIKARGLDFTISVNVSPKQFVNGYILSDVKAALETSGIDPSCVILEITEGVLLNNVEEATLVLHQLIDLGISISMDDFGQGYSSLNYLRQHPFRYVKIDRSFIQGMDDSSQDRALVQASVAMARAMDLKVVAEGVEAESQELALRALGVDYLQGYRLARPMPFADYQKLILAAGSVH